MNQLPSYLQFFSSFFSYFTRTLLHSSNFGHKMILSANEIIKMKRLLGKNLKFKIKKIFLREEGFRLLNTRFKILPTEARIFRKNWTKTSVENNRLFF